MEKVIRDKGGKAHGDPPERTRNAHTRLDVGLEDQENDCSPEDNFKAVEDGIGLVGFPPAEPGQVFAKNLVGYDDHGFGALLPWIGSDFKSVMPIRHFTRMEPKKTHHAQGDGVGSGSRLAFHEQLRHGQAHDNRDQYSLENVHFELVSGVEQRHIWDVVCLVSA